MGIHKLLTLKHTRDSPDSLELYDAGGRRFITITDESGSATFELMMDGSEGMFAAAIQQAVAK